MARYAVGAVKQMVARHLAIAANKSSGGAFSRRMVEAPARKGNSTSPPRPKVKASGGEPMTRSCALGAQHVPAVRVAGRQHVAVKMHGALGLAGRARGKADQADVVGGGVAGREIFVARPAHQAFERISRIVAPIDDALQLARQGLGFFHLVGEPCVAERQRNFRLAAGVGKLLRAQERHGGDHDAARLHHRQNAGDHHRIVEAAQEHAVAGHEPAIAREHIGDAVHALGELRIAQGFDGRDQAGFVALPGRDPAVEQFAARN